MQLQLNQINHNQPIPETFAFCAHDPKQHVVLAANRNPAVTWRDTPIGTKSLVLLCADTDAPSKPDDVNQEDREVPADLPRADFYHWVMVDIPPTVTHIRAAAYSDGVTPHGKQLAPEQFTPEQLTQGLQNARQGLNDYTGWFAQDKGMAGDYYGYDGPCPPWNDALIHRYYFRLYATDLQTCPVKGRFTGQDVMRALQSHILAQTEIMGTYSLNPRLRE